MHYSRSGVQLSDGTMMQTDPSQTGQMEMVAYDKNR